jgi:hypothetical protein
VRAHVGHFFIGYRFAVSGWEAEPGERGLHRVYSFFVHAFSRIRISEKSFCTGILRTGSDGTFQLGESFV